MRWRYLVFGLTAAVSVSSAYTVESRLEQYGKIARQNLAPAFKKAQVSYPPKRLVLLVIKETGELSLYASGADGKNRFIKSYPILAASGELGPKLRQGDGQVPEGTYRVELLNPNSLFHLSLRLNYPNEWDRARAREDGRRQLGGDIMIHGNQVSIGCVAIGDRAIEELFVLSSDVGLRAIEVIVAPLDFRGSFDERKLPSQPPWVKTLYAKIREAMIADCPR